MSISKEAELINSIVVFFRRCEEEGDYNALYEMGFGPSEVRALSALSSADILRIASMKSHFLTIKLNREVYWRLIDYLLREQHKGKFVNELIVCDAPMQMMRSLTGMNAQQFHLKRCQLGLPDLPAGRPPRPTMEVEKSVWIEVEKLIKKTASFGPKEFMDIYDALKREVSLRTIWGLIQEWENDGSFQLLSKS